MEIKSRNMEKCLLSIGMIAVFILLTIIVSSGCFANKKTPKGIPHIDGLEYESTVKLKYANQFSIYKYEGGYSYIDMVDSDKILVVPKGKDAPKNLSKEVVIVEQPLNNIYLVSTSSMALFDSLDALDNIKFVGTTNWYIDNAIKAVEADKWIQAGKYNAPDYETLIDENCELAIENTMILHNPEVKEKMLELGIKTIVERSSYEEHPLGRTEWIKIYGTILGKEELADKAFNEQVNRIKALESIEKTNKTVAFFYVNSTGNVVTYKTKGYLPEMIRIAGGEYIFSDLGLEDESKLSSVNMSMEEFYNSAKDADILIYNASIMAPVKSMEQFLDKSPVLSDFKAVKEGNVWCTNKNMYQQTDKMGSIIEEMSFVFSDNVEKQMNMEYIFKVK